MINYKLIFSSITFLVTGREMRCHRAIPVATTPPWKSSPWCPPPRALQTRRPPPQPEEPSHRLRHHLHHLRRTCPLKWMRPCRHRHRLCRSLTAPSGRLRRTKTTTASMRRWGQPSRSPPPPPSRSPRLSSEPTRAPAAAPTTCPWR
jgi:hypothetical protein